jgi:pimeloyl-ACP methyl ester carboxylesterase
LPEVTLGFDDRGSGLPVVMLHGFPHDRSLWLQQRNALSTRVRCILPDLRGFGESSSHGPHSMDQYADDVVALLDHLDVPQAVVCGLSMGGYIAMAMWRRHAERIRAMVLCDTRATPDTDETRAVRNELIALARKDGARAVAERQLKGMLGKTTHETKPHVVAHMRAMMERQSVEGIAGALAALGDRPDSRPTVASISVPTLVVVGEEDTLTPPSDAEAMIDLLPPIAHARLERIANAGHASCVERPAAVSHVLAEFLSTLAPERGWRKHPS